MSILGPALTQSIAGLNQAERVAARDQERKKSVKPDGKRRVADEVEIDVETAQAADAVRNLKGNGDEETAEDRAEHDRYQTDGKKTREGKQPRIDLQG